VLTAHSRCLRAVPRARLLHGARRTSQPLQSAAYASASTRSLCAPQRAHNAVSFCPVCSISSGQRPTSRAPAARRAPCYSLVWRFGGRAPPQLQRVLALSPPRVGRLPSALLRTTWRARNRCSRSVSTVPPPLGKPDEESLRPTLLPADSCRTAGIEEMGLHRSRQSVVSSNKRPRVGTALPLTAACSGSRFWRALGPPGDQSGDLLGSVGMRGLTPRGKDAPCATDSLTTCYETPDAAPPSLPLVTR